MASFTKTINFLPAVFDTTANRKFLGATLDQLVSEPNFRKINGYIGRSVAPTFKPTDSYIAEPSKSRQHYQLEPSVVIKDDDKNITSFSSYEDLIQKIGYYGGIVSNHSRLFQNESYTFDGQIDFDKLVNFSQYYWMPVGPESVNVFGGTTALKNDYLVTKNTELSAYQFIKFGSEQNPDLVLARGGVYTFTVDQASKFWIQTSPGTDGKNRGFTNLSSRDVLGVSQNGSSNGVVTFMVPQKNAQSFYTDMPIVWPGTPGNNVDYATSEDFITINKQLVSSLSNGIDGVTTNLHGKYLVFVANQQAEAAWEDKGVYDLRPWSAEVTPPGNYDQSQTYPYVEDATYAHGTNVPPSYRTGIWQIQLENVGNMEQLINLVWVQDIPSLSRIVMKAGNTYAGTSFYKTTAGLLALVPALTAQLDTLFYSDDTNSSYYGKINIVDNVGPGINVLTNILGKKNYTSPNDIVFTNGLKVTFDTSVTPSIYVNQTYYVEGVGRGIRLVKEDTLVTPELNYLSDPLHFDIYGYDVEHFDEQLNGPITKDYITINRSSVDGNAWSRSNRWFHEDAITATAIYNKNIPQLQQSARATRPIIEFDPDLKLYNNGVMAYHYVDVLDLTTSNAMVDVEGDVGSYYDDVALADGTTVVFANDFDPIVKNKVFKVRILDIMGKTKIHLEPFAKEIQAGDVVVPTTGTVVPLVQLQPGVDSIPFQFNVSKRSVSPTIALQPGTELGGVIGTNSGVIEGSSFWFNGEKWVECQRKNAPNVPPLFEMFDANGKSFADQNVYPNSTFAGTKIFSFTLGTGKADSILGFPLTYRNFNTMGDIEFENNFDTGSFSITVKQVATRIKLNTGYIHRIKNRTAFTKHNVWSISDDLTKQYQIISNTYDGRTTYFEIDIAPAAQSKVPHFKVYVNNKRILAAQFSVVPVGARTAVYIPVGLKVGDRVDIMIYSDQISNLGFYEVPQNLNLNTLNEEFQTLTLGQFRNHLTTIADNSTEITGPTPGSSNLRDIDMRRRSGSILQHASPTVYGSVFLIDDTVNFMESAQHAQKEYTRFKNRFLELFTEVIDRGIRTADVGVDYLMTRLNTIKNSSSPWYYSDMVPYGIDRTIIDYSVLNAEIKEYPLDNIYNEAKLSNVAVLVYVDGKQMIKNHDYTYTKTRASIIFADPLVYGQHVQIRVFNNTDGCYVPETPSKMGLYPTFKPEMYFDTTYQIPVDVIRGHDGSITPAFGDFRDELLLELEIRIYNNIKAVYDQKTFDINAFVPGQYRKTDYTRGEFDAIISRSFLSWIGSNRIDYSENSWFVANNPWTWTYNQFVNKVTGEQLPGHWRGIYQHFYGTDAPHLHPWEMLGFSEMPDWWIDEYDVAPYTGGNAILWSDLELGLIRQGPRAGIDPIYARPGLSSFIPVTASGQLLSPQEYAVGGFNNSDASSPFQIGDTSPVEAAWKKSSDYPFAIQQALALMKPALYFARLANTQQYFRDEHTSQFAITATNQRLTPHDLVINGDTSSGKIERATGYLNWIADYLTYLGISPAAKIKDFTQHINVQLGYRAAGFTDQSYLRVLAEQSSPTSQNESIVIPNENYQVYLHKSTPVARIVYSAVIVEKTNSGYSVSGYNTMSPYFVIIPSVQSAGRVISAAGASVTVYDAYDPVKIAIPYGHNFINRQQLVEFLIGYGRYLNSQGFVFSEFSQDLGVPKDWDLSIREFLTWTQQGWGTGSILVLSPVSSMIAARFDDAVVDNIGNFSNGSKILDVSFNVVPTTLFNVLRDGHNFSVTTAPEITIGLADLSLVQYEHALIFDNETVFKDVIYKPSLGNRQYRLKLIGNKTDDWTGELAPPGFIYSNPKVQTWTSGKDYKKGEIAQYKNLLYVALVNVDAADEFNYGYWKQTDKNSVSSGLLPNFSYNAKKFENFYDVDNQILDQNFNAYANGLIGYRERSYLNDLSITPSSQVKFYQGYIKDKGTSNAVSSLQNASFNNLSGDMSYKEEWAFRVGHYGAVESDQYLEVQLSEKLFKTDIQTVTILPPGGEAESDKIVGVFKDQLYKKPLNFNPNVFNTRDAASVYANDIKSAGYVNLEDIDATLFNMTDVQLLNDRLSEIKRGYKIWVANDTRSDWNVYRLTENGLVVKLFTYTSQGQATVTFDQPHGMVEYDVMMVKGFNAALDGFYTVIEVESMTTLTVKLSTAGIEFLAPPVSPTAIGAGVAFALMSMRATYLTDLAKTPALGWKLSDRVWVDNDTADGNWAVYKKTMPWDYQMTLNSDAVITDDASFGADMALSKSGMIMLTSESIGTGAVTTYVNTLFNAVTVVSFVGNGSSTNFTMPDASTDTNTAVKLAGQIQIAGVDYYVTDSILWFYSAPAIAAEIEVTVTRTGTNSGFVRAQNIFPNIGTNNFGVSLYINDVPASGGTNGVALIGAAGEVYAYTVQPGGFLVRQAILLPPTPDANFGSHVSISNDNQWILISATNSVYLYSRHAVINGGIESATYSIVKNISAPVISSGFGSSLAINDIGTLIAIGAPHEMVAGIKTGAAYLFTRYQTTVSAAQVFTLGQDVSNARFGTSLCFANYSNDLLIGAPGYSVPGYRGGKVFRYINKAQTYNVVIGTEPLENFLVIPGSKLVINGIPVDTPNSNIVQHINDANILGITASLVDNKLRVAYNAPTSSEKLTIHPYLFNSVVSDIPETTGIELFSFAQAIEHPYRIPSGEFGHVVTADPSTETVVIAGRHSTTLSTTTVDDNELAFDDGTTMVYDSMPGTGAAYVYNVINNAANSFDHPSALAFTQQLVGVDPMFGDKFGQSLATAKNNIFVGAPGDDRTNNIDTNEGRIFQFTNPTRNSGWIKSREELPTVDLNNVSRLFIYDRKMQETLSTLDYIDPIKGKVLGVAEQDIDFKTTFDPAGYNMGIDAAKASHVWGSTQVGKIWWNLSTVRYVDYEQDALTYRIQNWGKLFPGSKIEVLEWIRSKDLPSAYRGEGKVKYYDDSAYVEEMSIDKTTGIIHTYYFYWVSEKTTVDSGLPFRRTSASAIASLIEYPELQGIPYAAVIRSDSLSIFGIKSLVKSDTSILHVDYSLIENSNIIHNEYELVKEGLLTEELPTQIIDKMIDSITGEDESGNQVPDSELSIATKFGIGIRPRQTMIGDRLSAVRNLVGFVNTVCSTVPVVLQFDISKLFTEDRPPAMWDPLGVDLEVANLDELSYIDIRTLLNGQEILVRTDANFDGQWAIHTVTTTEVASVVTEATFKVNRTQSFRVTDFWTYADWYAADFDPTEKPTHIVNNDRDITNLVLRVNETIVVRDRGDGKFMVYMVNEDLTTLLIGVQDGTIELSDALWAHANNRIGFDNAVFDSVKFDLNPALEMRIIIEALRDDIFINTLGDQFSKLFFVLLKYIMTEQRSVDWVFKTSFISVLHNLRKLEQFPNYIKDNMSYYEDYVNEVKPYRTKIREYLVTYSTIDAASIGVTDFDLPSYFDSDFGVWRSPSNEHARDELLLTLDERYFKWAANHGYSIERVHIEDFGSGFTAPPTLEVIGGGGTGAKLEAVIDYYLGVVIKVNVINPGSGYTSTPTILVNNNPNALLRCYPMMKNNTVRSFATTIKFDRVAYESPVVQWEKNTLYAAGDIVSYRGNAYSVNLTQNSGNVFSVSNYTLINEADLPNAIDRVVALYKPTIGMTPADPRQLFRGIEYWTTTTDGGGFIELPGAEHDTIFESFFTDVYDGIEDDIIDSGQFVDEYSSHAPEELIPGLTYDTLDIQVYTIDPALIDDNSPGSQMPAIGFRVSKTMANEIDPYYVYVNNVAQPRIAILTKDLLAADTTISISTMDNLGNMLQTPTVGTDPVTFEVITSWASSDVVYINGEKIRYTAINRRVHSVTGTTYSLSGLTRNQNNIGVPARVPAIIEGRSTPIAVEDTTAAWEFRRICSSATTALAKPLEMFDDKIYVVNATACPAPNPTNAVPGVVYIGGEKITYYEIDYAANTLGRLTRGAWGTGTPVVHLDETLVVDASIQQKMPGNPEFNLWLDVTSTIGGSITVTQSSLWGPSAHQSEVANFLRSCMSSAPGPGAHPNSVDPNANKTRFDDDGSGQYLHRVHPFDIDPWDSYSVG